jgi:hypothetical protein
VGEDRSPCDLYREEEGEGQGAAEETGGGEREYSEKAQVTTVREHTWTGACLVRVCTGGIVQTQMF